MVKNNHLSAKVEGNGVHDENSLVEDNIKCEPLELTGGNGGANTGNNEDSSDSGAEASDRLPASASSNEHEQEPEHTSSAQNFLQESKLFTPSPGSFNFSMAALTTDHTPLSGTSGRKFRVGPVRTDQFRSSEFLAASFILRPLSAAF